MRSQKISDLKVEKYENANGVKIEVVGYKIMSPYNFENDVFFYKSIHERVKLTLFFREMRRTFEIVDKIYKRAEENGGNIIIDKIEVGTSKIDNKLINVAKIIIDGAMHHSLWSWKNKVIEVKDIKIRKTSTPSFSLWYRIIDN